MNDNIEAEPKDDVILRVIEDLVSKFLCYDRKEDEDLPIGTIEEEIKKGNISIDEMVNQFKESLGHKLKFIKVLKV